ncbi:MAG: hypothetical protein JWQ62_592 [Lacunisphaera sp.]|nr:hypothetical protein [Lacunisphaera sp.]
MNLTDELQRLAKLHQAGELSDPEFIAAKERLLREEEGGVPPGPPREASAAAPPDFEEKTYYSSRWSSGNLFFRDRLKLAADGMHFRKGALFSSQEEHIAYRAIASLRVANGVFLANLNVETSGGSQPIFINGLWKSDARKIQAAVQAMQGR